MREWAEIPTKMNLAKADDLVVEYEIELVGPWECDVVGVFNRAEQKRFDLVVSDYASGTRFAARWQEYRALIEELRSEERPGRVHPGRAAQASQGVAQGGVRGAN